MSRDLFSKIPKFFLACALPLLLQNTVCAEDSADDFKDSAFIKLMNAENQGKIPFPFQSLLNSFGTGVPERGLVLFVPKGRSLVKNFADLTSPRIIVDPLEFTSSANSHSDWKSKEDELAKLGIKKGDIYIGYAPNHEALEVISYNPAKNRRDFFVVNDYGIGKTPKISSNRAICVTCHQSGELIFPRSPWHEMLGNTSEGIIDIGGFPRTLGKNELMERVAKANPHRDSIEGIPIKSDYKRFDPFNVVNFDVGVREANQDYFARNACNLLCAGASDELQCKQALFRQYARTLSSDSLTKKLPPDKAAAEALQRLKAALPHFDNKSSFIPDRDPDHQAIEGIYDPITPRGDSDELIKLKQDPSMAHALSLCFSDPEFKRAISGKSDQEITRFLQSPKALPFLKSWPLDRDALANLTRLKEGKPTLDRYDCDGSLMANPLAVESLNAIQNAVEKVDSSLVKAPAGYFKKYCTECHGGRHPFIVLPLDSIKDLSEYVPSFSTKGVLERLQKKIMPPDGAPQPSDQEREQMIEAIKAGN